MRGEAFSHKPTKQRYLTTKNIYCNGLVKKQAYLITITTVCQSSIQMAWIFVFESIYRNLNMLFPPKESSL